MTEKEGPLTPEASPSTIKTPLPISPKPVKPTIESLTKELSNSKSNLQLNHSELTKLYLNISIIRDTIVRNGLNLNNSSTSTATSTSASVSEKNKKEKGKGKVKESEEVLLDNSGDTIKNANQQILLPLTYISMSLPIARQILNLNGDETSLEIWELYVNLLDKVEPTTSTSNSSSSSNLNYKTTRGAILCIALLQPLKSRLRIVADRMILDEITAYMNWLLFGVSNEEELLKKGIEKSFNINQYLLRDDKADEIRKNKGRYCNIEGRPKSFEVVELNDALTFLKVDESCSVEELVLAIKISQVRLYLSSLTP